MTPFSLKSLASLGLIILHYSIFLFSTDAFSLNPSRHLSSTTITTLSHQSHSLSPIFLSKDGNDEIKPILDFQDNFESSDEKLYDSRRSFFQKVVSKSLLPSMLAYSLTTPAANAVDYTLKEPVIWKSGKTPTMPGKKPKSKDDLNGTKKDPNFLRSISACKSQCENSVGPDGFAKSKEECLSDCQDICCTTYEQCTFGIVPRI